ncbi:putative virion structural protein [Erwinia phage vB_EamM_Kwan]|uniref:Putative virion structural protein n=1 Tax=Erwinia phage vB_EamM_Kwan TaxID=1883374 RepID=A0A1B2IE25_9CAUD|nr:putative virion structural protein [Erwinia phage vB_EamM_Kwan]ANZ49455.1 putative virion structural protein [Erwinia phage vB_EamM_Kwan]
MANSKVYDGKINTVTLSAMRLTSALLCGAPVKYPQKSTLNEHLNLMTAKIPDPAARPTIKYMCIGIKGHTAELADDDIYDFVPLGKKASYSGMYKAMPFVLRRMDNDLSDAQRANYAFRTKLTIGGVDYWAYYLKRIDMRSVETTDYDIRRENGEERVDLFNYTDNELYPTPGTLPEFNYDDDTTVELPDGRYAKSNVELRIGWNDFDVQEYMNVCAIMRGSSQSSIVSEIAVCSGLDAVESGESATGSKFSYDEAIGVQVMYYIDLYANLAVTNDNLELTINIGQTVPFWLGPN